MDAKRSVSIIENSSRRIRQATLLLGRVASVCILTLLCVNFSCKETPPGPTTPATITLAFEDASCTEAWLKVSLTDANEPRMIAIKRDGTTVLTARLTANDTTVVDTSLLPKRNYSYQAIRLNNNSPVDTSPTLQVTTMDTTSHSFQFSIDTLGVTSSVLYDVAIINDTLAYAVGEIFLNDSTGQLDPVYYNVAKWNGRRWEIFRILSNCRLYYPNCGPVTLTVAPGRAVFAFAWNDIWIAAGGIHHFDGSQWTEQRAIVEVGSTNKIWGSSSSNLWLVGNNGLIINYNGSTWQRVESGTTLNMYDVKGASSQQTNHYEILAVGGRLFEGPEHIVLRVERTGTMEIPISSISSTTYSLWFKPERTYYVVGSGMFAKHTISSTTPWRDLQQTNYFIYSLRGQELNDIVACGAFGEFLHFNGLSWKSFRLQTRLANGTYTGVAFRGDRVFAAGFESPRAVVLRGFRMR